MPKNIVDKNEGGVSDALKWYTFEQNYAQPQNSIFCYGPWGDCKSCEVRTYDKVITIKKIS